MKRIQLHMLAIVSCLTMGIFISCSQNTDEIDFSERAKVAIRAVGNDVLLSQQDTTSLVMPVVLVAPNMYELSFENPLAFDPGSLNASVTTYFTKANLPPNYRVEVLQCGDEDVAHSFEMQANMDNTIMPCGGRILPEACYVIRVKFTEQLSKESENATLFYILIFLVLAFLAFVFYSKYYVYQSGTDRQHGTSLGSFTFYPDQNKLVKEAQEIPLSKKECELLEIFIAAPNQVIKREELTKKVWEDNGVIVGRSLDTYISKLRKKLQEDGTIKITNVHGVGYKLEVA